MTQEEKQILLKDIGGRLPYGVKLGFKNSSIILTLKNYDCFTGQLFTRQVFPKHDGTIEYGYQIYDYRPYLRPMSSMTEEELKELNEKYGNIAYFFIQEPPYYHGLQAQHSDIGSIEISEFSEIYDWLNAHHFDYRGLIPMGLALEAPKYMYKTE